MHQPQAGHSAPSQTSDSTKSDERRARRREEGVLSRIEDITYKVLRQHEPKKP
jgi:hypothetical protein